MAKKKKQVIHVDENGMKHLRLGVPRGDENKPPHFSDGHQRKNGGIDDLVGQAVGKMGQGRVGRVPCGKPAVHQIERHGNKQQPDPQRVKNRIPAPHDGHGAEQPPENQGRSGIDQKGG